MNENNSADKIEAVEEDIRSVECEVQGIWQRIVADTLKDYRQSNKRMFWIIIALIGALLLSNGFWLYEWTQYDMVTYSQDGEGYNNINNRVQGSVHNNNGTNATGESEAER